MKFKGEYADKAVVGEDFDENWDRIFGTEEERRKKLRKEIEKQKKVKKTK